MTCNVAVIPTLITMLGRDLTARSWHKSWADCQLMSVLPIFQAGDESPPPHTLQGVVADYTRGDGSEMHSGRVRLSSLQIFGPGYDTLRQTEIDTGEVCPALGARGLARGSARQAGLSSNAPSQATPDHARPRQATPRHAAPRPGSETRTCGQQSGT